MSEPPYAEVLQAHGFEADSVERIPMGRFNDTFRARCRDGSSVVLRIAPPDDTPCLFYEKYMMAREPETHETVRRYTSLPVPEIYVYDDSRRLLTRPFLIMEYLRGRSLVGGRSLHREIGRLLAELHSRCTGTVFGYTGAYEPLEPQKDWASAFHLMWEALIGDIVRCGAYSDEDGRLALEALQTHRDCFTADFRPVLLHMDIWGQNVLEYGEEISGIIDWDRALYGDPGMEYAVLEYCGFDNTHFWQGYGGAPAWCREREVRQLFYHLYEVQKYLFIWTVRRPMPTRVAPQREYCLKRLRGVISQ